MLANNNRRIIQRLARNNLRREWKRTLSLFVAIALAALLLFSVITSGITYLSLSRLQDTRIYGGEQDILISNGYSSDQLALLEKDVRVESVGQQAYAGFIQSTEADDTVSVGLLWDDAVLWNSQRAEVITAQEGDYPTAANEVMVSADALAACGLKGYGVGDRFTATVETNRGIMTEEFVISGIWEGYGDTAPIYVSREFFDRSGYDLTASGILSIKLACDYVLPQTIDELRAALDLNEMQVFQSTSYIDNSWKVLAGISGISLVIGASAYLLIYNILYLSATEKSHYYGLLQTLGMTERQIVQLLLRQMLSIALAALACGLVLGAVTTFLLMPQLMNALGITSELITTHFHPLVLGLTIVCVSAAVAAGLHAPLKAAQQSSLLAALKRQPSHSRSVNLGRGGSLAWRLAFAELRRQPKKTVVVLASLALSFSVFVCLSTLVSSQDERTVMPLYWNADLLVRNDSETSEDIASYQPILEGLAEEIRAVPGVCAVHEVVGVPFTLTDDDFAQAWLGAYSGSRAYLDYDEVMANFRSDRARYYGRLLAVDADEFDHLNSQLAEPIDRAAFLDGEIALAAAGGIPMPEEFLDGAPLTFEVGGETIEVYIAAEVYENGDLGASRNIGPNLIVSQRFLARLKVSPIVTNLSVHYETPEDAQTEKAVMEVLAARAKPETGDLFWQSHLDEVEAIQATEGDLNEIGAAIALLLLVIGLLNYVNTMAASVQNRRLAFSIMESLGMTRGQLWRQLVCEGLLIFAGVLVLTATIGLAVTLLVFQAMNHMGAAFSLPLAPIFVAVVLVLLVCVSVPLFCAKWLVDDDTLRATLRMSE